MYFSWPFRKSFSLHDKHSTDAIINRIYCHPAHREINSQSCLIQPKSDFIHQFPIGFEPKDFRLVPNQSETGK